MLRITLKIKTPHIFAFYKFRYFFLNQNNFVFEKHVCFPRSLSFNDFFWFLQIQDFQAITCLSSGAPPHHHLPRFWTARILSLRKAPCRSVSLGQPSANRGNSRYFPERGRWGQTYSLKARWEFSISTNRVQQIHGPSFLRDSNSYKPQDSPSSPHIRSLTCRYRSIVGAVVQEVFAVFQYCTVALLAYRSNVNKTELFKITGMRQICISCLLLCQKKWLFFSFGCQH